MPVLRPLHHAALALLVACCTACSRLPSVGDLPLVYRLDIQQGNVITQEMLAQLRPGMNQRQAQFVMGTPLVRGTFDSDRWDYLYRFDEKGEDTQHRLVTLVFNEGVLQRVEGDVLPAQQPLEVDPRDKDKTVEVPPAPPANLFARITGLWSDKPKGTVVDPSTKTQTQDPSVPQ